MWADPDQGPVLMLEREGPWRLNVRHAWGEGLTIQT